MNLAARGARNLDDGQEAIDDPAVLAQVRRQARKVHLDSVATGILLAALSVAILLGRSWL